MKYIATYTLNRPDGSTSIHTSMPYKTLKEAKTHLDEELHRMKDSGELDYAEKVYVYGDGTAKEGLPIDVLNLVKAIKGTLESAGKPLQSIFDDAEKETNNEVEVLEELETPNDVGVIVRMFEEANYEVKEIKDHGETITLRVSKANTCVVA